MDIPQISEARIAEEYRVLRETRQIMFLGGPNSEKETLWNQLKASFPCPKKYLNDGPFRSIFQPNAFMEGKKVRLLLNSSSDVPRGFLKDVYSQKPELVVICGHANGGSHQFQKWHDYVAGYDHFMVRWIVLPGKSPSTRDGSCNKKEASGHNADPERTPEGEAVLQYGNGSIKQNIQAIAKDLTNAAHRSHFY